MEDIKGDILDIAKKVAGFNEVKLAEIPDIDLYMDQVTSFIDNKLSSFKRDKEDIILTKTMINNYAKAGILLPPVKKRYTREHMILLIWIYYLKQALPINDINTLFEPIIGNDKNAKEKNPKVDLFELYEKFLDIQRVVGEDFYNNISENIGKVKDYKGVQNSSEIEKAFLVVITLILNADMQKRMAQKIIDNYFAKDLDKQ